MNVKVLLGARSLNGTQGNGDAIPLTNTLVGDLAHQPYDKRGTRQPAPFGPHRCESNKIPDLH